MAMNCRMIDLISGLCIAVVLFAKYTKLSDFVVHHQATIKSNQLNQHQGSDRFEEPILSVERLQVRRSSFESISFNQSHQHEVVFRSNSTSSYHSCDPQSRFRIIECACDPYVAADADNDKWMDHRMRFILNHQQNTTRQPIDVVFLGDSIMERFAGTRFRGTRPMRAFQLEFENLFHRDQGAAVEGAIFGSATDLSQQLLWHIQNGIIPDGMRPKVVWFLIGTNNIFHNCSTTIDVFVESILTVAKNLLRLQPEALIVIQGILPRGDLLGQKALGTAFVQIQAINSHLRAVAELHPHLHFFELPHLFILPDENLIDTKLLEDCVHPTLAGYHVMGKLIQAEVQELLKRMDV